MTFQTYLDTYLLYCNSLKYYSQKKKTKKQKQKLKKMEIRVLYKKNNYKIKILILHPRRPRGSRSGREKRWDESFQVRAKEPRTISKNSSGCRLLIGHKKCLVLLCPIGEQFLLSSFRESYTTAIVSITACLVHAPKKCTQSGNFQFDIKSPSDFKILSARKLKTLFQKYKLELTTGIHACIGHASCVNTREFLKDTTTADSHENVAWKSEFTFFQSLS